MTASAGWYPDSTGAPRWWDGQRWGDEHPVPVATTRRVAPGTPADTLWVWLIVVLPVLSFFALFAYLFEVQRIFLDMFSMAREGTWVEPADLIADQMQLFFGPWALISTALGWVTYGLCVWCAALDAKELSRRGFERPFHWAWAFLWPVVYVIGRHVVVRRQGGRGSWPLVVTIITQAAVIVAAAIWNARMLVLLLQNAASIATFS